jgi:hypothetical protein
MKHIYILCLCISSLFSSIFVSICSEITKNKKHKDFSRNLRAVAVNTFMMLFNFFAHDINPLLCSIFGFANIFNNIKKCNPSYDNCDIDNKMDRIIKTHHNCDDAYDNKYDNMYKCTCDVKCTCEVPSLASKEVKCTCETLGCEEEEEVKCTCELLSIGEDSNCDENVISDEYMKRVYKKRFWNISLKKKYGSITFNNSDYELSNDGMVFLFFDFLLTCKNNKHSKISINLPVIIKNNNTYSSSIMYELYPHSHSNKINSDTTDCSDCKKLNESIESTLNTNTESNSDNTDKYVTYTNGKLEAKKSKIYFYSFPFETNVVYKIRGQLIYKCE